MIQGDDGTLDQDVREMTRLMPRFLRLTKGGSNMLPPELRPSFERAGLSTRHVPVLIAVAMNGPWSVGQVADHVALTPATTSQLVNELSRAGLLCRTDDPSDRRRTIVSVAPEHQQAIHAIASKRLALLREALSRLTAEERRHFLKGWRTLLDVAEQAFDPGQHDSA